MFDLLRAEFYLELKGMLENSISGIKHVFELRSIFDLVTFFFVRNDKNVIVREKALGFKAAWSVFAADEEIGTQLLHRYVD